MPTVTGSIQDIGLTFMPGLALRLKFVPNSPGTGPGGLLTTNPRWATPSTADGTFSVTLAETGKFWRQGRPVKVNVFAVWLNPNDPAGTGFDDFLMELEVPAAGGAIGDLTQISTGNDIVYSSTTALDSGVYSGFQLNTATGVVYKREDLI